MARKKKQMYPSDPQLTAEIIQALFDEVVEGDSLMMLPPVSGMAVTFLYNLEYCPPGSTH